MFKMRVAGLICLICLSLTLQAFGGTIPYEKAVRTARSEIWQAINSGKCGSATAAITVDGKVVYAEGFGIADREKSIPVGPKTLFNIGSISKVYVAAAIMLLVDDGKVLLDKPVTAYLPQFRMADDRYKKITVRMLLNHSSGLPGTEGSNAFGFKYDDNLKQETINTLARAHLKHDPGAMSVYCNDGFTLAEMIVEKVSGKKYMTFLIDRIFKPLGLKDTAIGVGEIKGRPVALFYDPKTGKKHPPETLSVLGAGGLSSTAVDLCRFVDTFAAENKLLKKKSLAEMRKAQPSAFADKLRHPQFAWGLGWDLTGLPRYDAAGVQILGKSGGTGNYSSMVYTIPDKKISVAVIAAGQHSGAMKIAIDILDAVLVEKKIIAEKENTPDIPPDSQKLPADLIAFGGYYADGMKVQQLVLDTEKNTATLFNVQGQEKTPAVTLVYADGYLRDPEGGAYYFDTRDGQTYLVETPPFDKIDLIILQKVKPLENPKSLKLDMDGKIWLRRNVAPFESVMSAGSHFEKSWLHKDLPGYVFFQGIKIIESPEFAGMPFNAMRDQSELTLFEKDGYPWAWVSDLLYSSASAAAPLKTGENSVKIGSSGYNEWLVADAKMILSFKKTAAGRVIIFSPEDETIWDSAIDAGDAYAAKGSYIELAGDAGDVFVVKAKTASSSNR